MDFFPKIVVVSLIDAEARRQHMREQLSRFPGLAFEFFDAIRVCSRQDFPVDYDYAARRRLFGDDLQPGEVGCFLSHREIWRLCAASGDPAWCVLEDDIVLHDHFVDTVSALMRHSERWDVVRLMELLPRRGSWVYAELEPGVALRAYDRQPSGMQGYLLKPRAAKRLAEHAARIIWPIDETMDLYWQHRLRLFSVKPDAIGLAKNFESTIGTRSSRSRPKWRKLQRELINGVHGTRRRIFNFLNR